MSRSFEQTALRVCGGIATLAAAANLFVKRVLPLCIFRREEATAVGIIGGADGPTLITVSNARSLKNTDRLDGWLRADRHPDPPYRRPAHLKEETPYPRGLRFLSRLSLLAARNVPTL